MNPEICLVHWNAMEAKPRKALLAKAGYSVDHLVIGPEELKRLRAAPPAAFVIDLSRLPSHGRDVALALREQKGTRFVPLVFVDGLPEKVEGIRRLLPDAHFTSWNRIRATIKRAMAHPPFDPVVPRSRLDGYSGTPLPKKLGIADVCIVELLDAPPGFEQALGALAPGVRLIRRMLRTATAAANAPKTDLSLWFVKSADALEAGVRHFARHCPPRGLWAIWRKKSALKKFPALAPGERALGEKEIRAVGLAAGLVDFKVCAVDETWSGLKFTLRKR